MTKKTMYLTGLLAVSTVLTASAQTSLYTTANDFAQFGGWWAGTPSAVTSTTYYSVASTVNGVGNTTAAGGAGTPGSLQLTMQNWGNPANANPQVAFTDAELAALAPGSSMASGITASSGTLSFDLYAPVAFTGSYDSFGFSMGYWSGAGWTASLWTDYNTGSYTTFAGADGNTWRHYSFNYTLPASASGPIQGFEMPFFMNADSADNGKLVYIDNVQVLVTPAPEPVTLALAGMGGAALLFFRRRFVS